MKLRLLRFLFLGLAGVLAGSAGYVFFGGAAPVAAVAEAVERSTVSPANFIPAPTSRLQLQPLRETNEPLPANITRLRSRGTPEPAVRDLASAEVSTHFAQKRAAIAPRELHNEAAADLPPTNHPSGFENSPPLGRRSAPSRNSAPTEDPGPVDLTTPALLPAVLVDLGPETPPNDLQVAERLRLEDQFVSDLGGENQNPRDSGYLARWRAAQVTSDDRFRQKFGTEAFLRHNIEAFRQSGNP